MASSWGNSWGRSWLNSWGALGTVTPPTQGAERGTYKRQRLDNPPVRDGRAKGAKFVLALSFFGGAPTAASEVSGASLSLATQFLPGRAVPFGSFRAGKATGEILGLSEDEFQHLLDLA